MSIFKEPFKENIKKQLKRRQDAMLNRTPSDLVYINGRNAWIRMSSSVNVYKSKSTAIADLKNEANYDNSLAKKYILQGGVLNENGTLKAGVGADFSNAYSRKSAEGIDYRLGIRPMPGITGIDVKSKGAYGSLRQVTVKFNCWDIHQLEDLELLYMRPGYTVLVEWGWAPYFDKDGNLSSTVSFYDIVDKVKTKETIWKELDTKMAENGNYEAMFGYVKNYSWNVRPDGGYDCTTEIISLGEVVESLKINYSPSTIIKNIKENKGLILPYLKKISLNDIGADQVALNILRGASAVTSLGLSELIIALSTESSEDKIVKAYTQNILAGLFCELYLAAENADTGTEDAGEAIIFHDTKKNLVYSMFHKTINMNGEDKEDDKTIGESDEQFYISLRSLVDILNNYVLVEDQAGKSPFSSLSIKDKDGNDLLALAHPLQVSIDPRVCLIKNMLWVNGMNINLVGGAATGSAAGAGASGDPVITFNSNIPGGTEAFVKTLIRIIIPVNGIGDRPKLLKHINETILGPENNRYSDLQAKENLKDVSSVYVRLYNDPNYKVEAPTPNMITHFNLSYDPKDQYGNKVGKPLKDGSSSNTFYDFLEDNASGNFETADIDKALGGTESREKIADRDPAADEKAKIKEQQEKLEELSKKGKEGIKFLENIPLPYFVDDDYYTELGTIGNIFINLRMLYEMSLDSGLEAQDKQEKKEIALYTFVKNLMSKISDSIGNVNNFEVFIEPNESVARIIDVNYVNKEDPKTTYNNAFEIQLHNLNSVVRSYKLESKIFQEQANIVAVGAQVGGGALGTDTTSLVAFNKGIIDRIIPVKDAPTNDIASSEIKAKVEALLANIETLYSFFGRLDSGLFTDADFDVDKASGYSNALKDLINNLRSLTTSKTNNKAILPTVLSIDMDGIGGLIIGNLFRINTDVLPKGYKGSGQGGIGPNLGYIITGIGHTVDKDWVTKIDAQTVILDDPTSEFGVIDYSNITININPSGAGGEGGGTPPIRGNPPNQTPSGKGTWETLNNTLLAINNQGQNAWKETGTNPLIINAYKEVGAPQSSDSVAWCAAFVGYVLKTSGLSYLKGNLSSIAYVNYGQEVPINDPSKWRKWDIAVWKHTNKPGTGHVSFVTGVTKSGILVLEPTSAFGGNQGNTVKTSKYPYKGSDMVLIGIRRNWTPPQEVLPLASGEAGGSTR